MAQIGNQNAAKGNMWRDAILRAVECWPEPCETGQNALMKGMNMAAHKYVAKMFEEEDLGFFKEFGDRIDGKPKQTQDINMGGEVVTQVTRKVIDPGNDAGT